MAQPSMLYLLILASVLFMIPGYAVLLRYWIWRTGSRPIVNTGAPALLPHLTVVIPVYNERDWIVWKLKNTMDLEYPANRKRILVIDGGSQDGTRELAESFAAHQAGHAIQIVGSPERGKIPQLNHALDLIAGDEFVILTDADSEVQSRDALLTAVNHLTDPTGHAVGVFGGWTVPPSDGPVPASERLFWKLQNRIRSLESAAFSSNIALAPFYAFRRDLLGTFPIDCVADDVYVSLACHAQRKRVIYSEQVRVTERRFPATTLESYRHKLRKTRAYSRELLRSVPSFPQMHLRSGAGCLFRLIVFGYWPWAALYVALRTPQELAQSGVGLWGAGLMACGAAGLATACFRFQKRARAELSVVSLAFAELSLLLLATLISNFVLTPFGNQHSIYRKVTGTF